MLTDHRYEQERRAARIRQRHLLPTAFGNFIAQLAEWDWFSTISFRDLHRDIERRKIGVRLRYPGYSLLKSDPRLKSWRPSSRWFRPGPLVPDWALAQVLEYMSWLQEQAGQPIGYVIGEEFGRLGGRYHCHCLIVGVGHLRRRRAWAEAFERFGRTKISPFDPKQAAAFYTAKYAAKQLGGLHFGGTLAGVDLSALENRPPAPGGSREIVKSAEVPTEFFHLILRRWHR